MSCNYYFEKWKNTIIELDKLVSLDIAYQTLMERDNKCKDEAHDHKWLATHINNNTEEKIKAMKKREKHRLSHSICWTPTSQSVNLKNVKQRSSQTSFIKATSLYPIQQEAKTHDKIWCDAVQRLIGMLGKYIFMYNEITDCYQHNLQVQKPGYMIEIIKAVVTRILELKDQLRKIIGNEYQFMGHGLVDHKLTTEDVILTDIVPKTERDAKIQRIVFESMERAEHRKKKSISIIDAAEIPAPEENVSQTKNWWDNDLDDSKEDGHKGINITAVYEVEQELTAKELETRNMATLIQAHEKSRQLTLIMIHDKLKREKWEKELNGTLRPPARLEIREKAAKIIQEKYRLYCKIKRERIKECKRDEMLGIRLCKKRPDEDKKKNIVEWNKRYAEKFEEYEKQWHDNYDEIKQKYIKRKRDSIEDDVRDELMHWFQTWYDKASYFLNIPKENDGGSILIVKEEIPTPEEWLEKYKAFLEQKRANKKKSAQENKYEKLQAKKEKLMEKKAELLKKKTEEQILKKMMKNPKYHPGYEYPKSKKLQHVIQAVEHYKTIWSTLDVNEESGVKEKFVKDIDIDNAYMDVKLEIRKSVDVAMRETFKLLNKALKEDYKDQSEQMPEGIKEGKKRKKKNRQHKIKVPEDIADKLEDLAYRGILKEYPTVKIEEFIGDPNFAGDDLRCNLHAAEAFSGETTALWWERCRELSHGNHRILLVGAKGSGKTTLVHILASLNDAVLYVIDPAWVPEDLMTAVYLKELASSIAECARATQPSVIYIRHLHRLYYRKAPPGENVESLNLIKKYLLRKLLKKIHKTDKITVLASCIDPWLSRSNQMLRQFPNVVLLPNSNYSTVTILLNNWMLENNVVPKDLDVQSLAYVLQGYSFGLIKDILSKFLTADRIIKIAAYGLPVHDILENFLDSEEVKIDYKKYLNWYTDKTYWGKKAKKVLEDQKEFQLLVEKYEQKKEKKKKLASTRSETSTNVDSTLKSPSTDSL